MKKNFYSCLCDRVERLSYLKNSPYKLVAKLSWWILRSCCTPEAHRGKTSHNMNLCVCQSKQIYKSTLNFAVILKGGIGDVVTNLILVKKLFEFLPRGSRLDVCVFSVSTCKKLLNKQSFYTNIIDARTMCYQKYDIVIETDVYFPKIVYKNPETAFNKKITKYIGSLEEFHKTFQTITRTDRVPDQMMLMELLHKNRITCLDIGDTLHISPSEIWQINVDDTVKTSVLKKWPQLKNTFITIGRGVDTTNKDPDSIRLWPVDYYNKWISLFKEKFPDITVVQLGGVKERCQILNCDLNLIGETSFEEVLCILKMSSLHLDGECGYVHLRHFLTAGKGKSLVIFGPTSVDIKGYSENINIRNNKACELKYCEWIAGGEWQTYCIKTKSRKSTCICAIDPEILFNKTEKEISAIF